MKPISKFGDFILQVGCNHAGKATEAAWEGRPYKEILRLIVEEANLKETNRKREFEVNDG